MRAILAIIGFMLFMVAVEVGIYLFYKIRSYATNKPMPEERPDASSVLFFALVGIVIFVLIGTLYDKLK